MAPCAALAAPPPIPRFSICTPSAGCVQRMHLDEHPLRIDTHAGTERIVALLFRAPCLSTRPRRALPASPFFRRFFYPPYFLRVLLLSPVFFRPVFVRRVLFSGFYVAATAATATATAAAEFLPGTNIITDTAAAVPVPGQTSRGEPVNYCERANHSVASAAGRERVSPAARAALLLGERARGLFISRCFGCRGFRWIVGISVRR